MVAVAKIVFKSLNRTNDLKIVEAAGNVPAEVKHAGFDLD